MNTSKSFRYISLILRFKCLFRNKEHEKSSIWHDEERIKDRKLRHPIDFLAWKQVDKMWSKIGDDLKNLHLNLSADGIIHS